MTKYLFTVDNVYVVYDGWQKEQRIIIIDDF